MAPDDTGVKAPAMLQVCIVYSPRAGEVDEIELCLSAGATVADALRASAIAQRHPEVDPQRAALGIWGVRCDAGAVLRDRDRVEIYRPLVIDPKEARRQRSLRQLACRIRR